MFGARPLAVARPGETTFHTVRFGGRQRSFLLHLPPRPRRTTPLLLAFHGYQANANVMEETTGLDAVADRHGWAVAYLNGTGGVHYFDLAWNAITCCGAAPDEAVDDVGFARAVADSLAARGLTDRRRVYATGFSNGGMLALRLACQPEAFVAGVADVAGAMPDTVCQGRTAVPVLLIRGANDGELRADHRDHQRRNRNAYAVSFAGALRYWSRRNGCATEPRRDSSATLVEIFAIECPAGRDVRELVVAGQAHAWPGGRRPFILAPRPAPDVDASERILDFFEREARAAAR
ncbi:MAG TPA: PHB depolymerase family esterase [Gemmatirosa sp.]